MTPAISVIMPVYNSSLHLREAIDSILNQTFSDFEFIIFNDGSTDKSRDIILSYNDKRIKFLDSKENLGYTKRLNKGLLLSEGKYIARMDSDDISSHDRFEKQFHYMETNNEVALCGGLFDFIGEKNDIRNFNWVTNLTPDIIKINLLFDCAICHPTVMMRRHILKENNIFYNESLEPSEDYELWIRMSRIFKLANLSDKILGYRISQNQISNRNNEEQRMNKRNLITDQLSYLGIKPSPAELRIHDHMFYAAAILSYDYIPKINAWIRTLLDANQNYQIYNQDEFIVYLNNLLQLNIVAFNKELGNAKFKKRVVYFSKRILKWNSIR